MSYRFLKGWFIFRNLINLFSKKFALEEWCKMPPSKKNGKSKIVLTTISPINRYIFIIISNTVVTTKQRSNFLKHLKDDIYKTGLWSWLEICIHLSTKTEREHVLCRLRVTPLGCCLRVIVNVTQRNLAKTTSSVLSVDFINLW